jgi:hypothetical protein
MSRDRKCMNPHCGKILFREVSPDGKSWQINDDSRFDFQSDETEDHFYKCPHCISYLAAGKDNPRKSTSLDSF